MYTFTSPQDGGGEESKQPHLGQLEDKGRIAQIMKSANWGLEPMFSKCLVHSWNIGFATMGRATWLSHPKRMVRKQEFGGLEEYTLCHYCGCCHASIFSFGHGPTNSTVKDNANRSVECYKDYSVAKKDCFNLWYGVTIKRYLLVVKINCTRILLPYVSNFG